MELKEGEYIIPEGCTVKRVGRTIQIYKTLKKTLNEGDLRCKDCQYFIRGHSVGYYTTEVCKMKPKKRKMVCNTTSLLINTTCLAVTSKREMMEINKHDRVVKKDNPNLIFRVTDIWQEKQLLQLDGDIWCPVCDLNKVKKQTDKIVKV